jgi:hypothetical protein
LRAVAGNQDTGIGHDEATRLAQLDHASADQVRARLRAKGLVYNPEPDLVRLTDPQFWRFIEGQPR